MSNASNLSFPIFIFDLFIFALHLSFEWNLRVDNIFYEKYERSIHERLKTN